MHRAHFRWRGNGRAVGVLLVAAWLALAGCAGRPDATEKKPAAFSSATVANRRTISTPPASGREDNEGQFTDVVTRDTVIVGRGANDRDIIFDAVAGGTRVRAVGVTGNYLRVVTDDGRDGLIARTRLQSLLSVAPRVKEPNERLVWAKSALATGAGDVAVEKISQAIDKGVEYLQSQQRKDGGWNQGDAEQMLPSLRLTALACLALFEGGQGSADAATRKATELLSAQPLPDMLGNAMRLEALSLAPRHSQDKTLASDEMIAATRFSTSAASVEIRNVFYDKTTSPMVRYSLLRGVTAAERAGMEIPTQFWSSVDGIVKKCQRPDGGWTDERNAPGGDLSHFRATAAGVFSLRIAEDYLDRIPPSHYDICRGNAVRPNYDRGMEWIRAHIDAVWNDLEAGKTPNSCQTLWWLHEVIIQSGERRMQGKDYGAAIDNCLIGAQRPDGSWGGDVAQTAYAIRALSDSALPVGFGKLVYPPIAEHGG